MCVCVKGMCVRVYVRVGKEMFTFVCSDTININKHTIYKHTHIHTHTQTHTYTHTHSHTLAHTYIHTHIHTVHIIHTYSEKVFGTLVDSALFFKLMDF